MLHLASSRRTTTARSRIVKDKVSSLDMTRQLADVVLVGAHSVRITGAGAAGTPRSVR